ncbi:MAG: phosphatidylglycerophosphatase A [Alphaproteobacteria bacterium]|nr:phosphatidylglycerophosphatase A [Alphaproteobacteria bacterium]
MLQKFSFLKQAPLAVKINYGIATGLGSGLSPKAPGTVGSFCALLPIWGAIQFGSIGILVLTFFFFITGWYATHVVLSTQLNKDPGYVVIDEFAGQAITFLFVASYVLPWYYYLLGFGLFRFFDIIKIGFVSYFDKKVQNAFGVMTDDIFAGLYAGIILYGIHYFL